MSLIRRRMMMAKKPTNGMDANNYLTIEALADGLTAKLSNNACEYCIDGSGEWIALPAGTATSAINAGQIVSFRGNITPGANGYGIGTFTVNKTFNLKGNCMSMLFGDDAVNRLSLSDTGDYAFYFLFKGNNNLITVSENFLPALILKNGCYYGMFQNCKSLSKAPKLPSMTLADFCYMRMFEGCTSLVTAPELPAEDLVYRCYYYTFCNCSKLNYIKVMALSPMTMDYYYMFADGSAASGTFVKNKNATWSNVFGMDYIPSGWTVITE